MVYCLNYVINRLLCHESIVIIMQFLNLAQSEPDEPDYMSEPEK